VSYDSASNESRLLASNATWSNLNATFRYAAVWKDTGTAGTSPLLGLVDLGATTITGTTFTIQWDTTGVLKITAAT
jgi:hypothetical protein